MTLGPAASDFLPRRPQNRLSRQPTQRKLRPLRHPRPLLPRPRNKPKLPPDLRHPARHLLAVLSGAYRFFCVPLLIRLAISGISRAQKGETLADDGSEQYVGKEPLAPSLFRSRGQSFQLPVRSVIPGISGQADTPTASPAFRSCSPPPTAQSGRALAAPQTCQPRPQGRYRNVQRISDRSAIFLNKSISRTIWFDFVSTKC